MREGPAPNSSVCFLRGTRKKSPQRAWPCFVAADLLWETETQEGLSKQNTAAAPGRRISPEAVPE